MLVLTQLPVHGSYAGNLLVGLLPMSIGMGLTFVPITLLGTSGVKGEDAGLASGLFNTAQQVGGSLGLAILSSLAASRTSSLLHGPPATARPRRRRPGCPVTTSPSWRPRSCWRSAPPSWPSCCGGRHTREIELELATGGAAPVPV